MDSKTPAETSEIAALREMIQLLERQLEDAREREARLFRLLEQRSLLAQSPPSSLPQAGLTMRQRILQVLEKHPGLMHRKDIEEAVQSDRLLGNTLQKMAKKRLIIGNGRGSYELPSHSQPTAAH